MAKRTAKQTAQAIELTIAEIRKRSKQVKTLSPMHQRIIAQCCAEHKIKQELVRKIAGWPKPVVAKVMKPKKYWVLQDND